MKCTLFKASRFAVWIIVLCVLMPGAQKTSKENEEAKPPLISAFDTLRFNQVGFPRLSPDGKWVLYTKQVRDMDDKDLKSSTHIWRIMTDGKEKRQMTFGSSDCTSPAWFPDGKKIAFLSARGKPGGSGQESAPDAGGLKSQLFFMHIDGGEAWQATDHEESIQFFEISSDGTQILFVAQDPMREEDEERKKKKDDAEVVGQEFRMSHVWIYDVEKDEAQRLTEGSNTVSDAHWSPDAKRIVYEVRPNPSMEDRNQSDIWVTDVAAKTFRKLYENPGRDTSPRWSPNGTHIAFASDPHKGDNTWHDKLYIMPQEGGEPKIFLENFDRNFGTPIWSPDGRTIYWSTGDKTSLGLFAVDLRTGEVETLSAPRGLNMQWQLAADGSRWVWIHSDPKSPVEVYTAEFALKEVLQLSDANPWLTEEKIKIADVRVISWKNSDGQWIEGVLTYPVDFQKGKKYPLIMNPHGGPSGAVMEYFNAGNQFFAGNGFMILQPNFRGSSNYGQEFLNANREQWGIRDYDDCMTGVDYCIEQGWVDPDRMVCYGWSYGGYMSFWIVTQTDRFKAVSPGAGLSNLYSMYSTTDIPHYLGWFLGTPWDNEEMYEKFSAIRHVKQVKSPVLIMHGSNDARVPPEQAVEFYMALKDLGKDVTFVRYPREGHGIREPRHQVDRLRRYLRFFAEHVDLTPVTDKD
ncbi:MAG: S9 family peptidase [Candidatus Aminicenantes bacterium]|nr:S9 family peptidase [Candidatus Aminicenantes bacterium]